METDILEMIRMFRLQSISAIVLALKRIVSTVRILIVEFINVILSGV